MTVVYHGICKYTLVRFYAVAAWGTDPESHGPLHRKVFHSVESRQVRLVEVKRTCGGVKGRQKKWAKGKWSDLLAADGHDSISNGNQWAERNWQRKSMRE